mmetsp:Transcript_14591/g.36902  ORF Transcript_14591/g.36902 Transcript_14591/m.36902 type:complete len:422 (+) Transcript_14591:86-1351(+)
MGGETEIERMEDLARYLLIPVGAAFIGYGTNVLALKMTFYPIDYIGFGEGYFRKYGIGPWHLGWQGIVPSKAAKMAKMSISLLTRELIDVREVFSRIDPEQVALELEPVLLRTLGTIVEEVAHVYAPDVWSSLPIYVREEVTQRVKEDTPTIIAAVISDIRANIHDIIDLEDMVVTHMVQDKELLNSVFMRAGEKEMRFIEQSGIYFGFLLGILQAAIFAVWRSWLILPIAGFISGYVTNWIALKLIFEPAEPTKVCGGAFELQGLFLRHQPEVAEAFGTAVACEIMSSEQLLKQLFLSPTSDKAIQIVHFHFGRAIDKYAGSLGPLLPLAIGGEDYAAMKRKVVELYVRELPLQIKAMAPYFTEALQLERTLVDGLKALPPKDFEGVLHPVFKEDEWLLILVGGILGFAVGVFQVMVVFK